MLRILIADDERLIRVGLEDLLNAEPGFSVVEAVSNGEEALNAVRRDQPDVVLTDIRMPRMDGRELVRELHSSYPRIRKVIISGYEDFSYAHETMKNGAIDYLLKPVDEKELIELLRGIEAEVAGEEERSNESRDLHSKLAQSLPLLREEFLLDLLHGCTLSDGEIAERLDFLGMRAGQGPYCAVRMNAGPSFADAARLAGEAARAFAAFLACEENGAAAFILGCPPGMAAGWTPDAAVSAIGEALERELNGRAVIGVGGAAEKLSGIAGSYREAVHALKQRFYDEETRVFHYEKVRRRAGSQIPKLPENYQEKLYADFINALETEKTEAVRDLLRRVGAMLKEGNVEADEALKLFSGLFLMLHSQNAGFRKAMDEILRARLPLFQGHRQVRHAGRHRPLLYGRLSGNHRKDQCQPLPQGQKARGDRERVYREELPGEHHARQDLKPRLR